jgi:hypothetical protein
MVSQPWCEPADSRPSGFVPLPVQALVTGRSISVMTGSFVDDFMTAAPTICLSTIDDFVTAAPTTVGDLESSVPTLVRDCVANTNDFDFEDSDTAAEEEEDTELDFDSDTSSSRCSGGSSSSGPQVPRLGVCAVPSRQCAVHSAGLDRRGCHLENSVMRVGGA